MLGCSGFTCELLSLFYSDAERHVQRNGRLFTDEGPGTTTEPHQQGGRHVCM